MKVSQRKYIEALAKKYGLNYLKSHKTSMEMGSKLEKLNTMNDSIPYRNIVGAILYVAAATRPDVSFCINYLIGMVIIRNILIVLNVY